MDMDYQNLYYSDYFYPENVHRYHQSRYSVYQLPLHLEPEKSLTERAVTLVTNNLSVFSISIPLVLLGITIVLFAIFFAPTDLMEQMITSLGFVNNSKTDTVDDDDKPQKKKIETFDLNQETKENNKHSEDEVEIDEQNSEEIFDNTLANLSSFPNFFSMVSDIMPTVADLSVPDILLSRNDSILELDTTVMFDTTTARPLQLQDLYDSESLLRYFTK